MLDLNEEELQDIIVSWLKNLEQAISEKNYNSLKILFDTDSYWRDLLAFTWNVTTVSGADKISESLAAYSPYIKASKFKIDKKRTPPRIITRAGKKVIEAIIRFETAYGQASGIVRFIFEDRKI